METPDQPIERIEVHVEGLPQDGGALRLGHLNNFLLELKKTLAAVEREITGEDRSVVAFKIVELSYNSPVKCVLEPISTKQAPSLGNKISRRFTEEINIIKDNKEPEGIQISTLEQIERFSALRHKQVGSVSIGPEKQAVELPVDFDVQLKRLLGNVFRSHGTFRGRLDSVNIHGNPCVINIYPVAGPAKVRGIYPVGRFPNIGEFLGKPVDVRGVMKYRGDTPHPYEVEIEDIVLLRTSQRSIADLVAGSMPDVTSGKTIATYLDEIRNEEAA